MFLLNNENKKITKNKKINNIKNKSYKSKDNMDELLKENIKEEIKENIIIENVVEDKPKFSYNTSNYDNISYLIQDSVVEDIDYN